ncbi:MAG TPA: SDR family oxidoreductase [Pseudonocardia sp.]|nr:SDR family oxidoreductase [Pseudonocardia sp.]
MSAWVADISRSHACSRSPPASAESVNTSLDRLFNPHAPDNSTVVVWPGRYHRHTGDSPVRCADGGVSPCTPATRRRASKLTDARATHDLVRGIGRVDALVYAAGPPIPMRYTSAVSPELYAGQMTADAVAALNLLQPAIEPLRASRGNIVSLVSAAMTRFATATSSPVAPKAAVEQVTKAIAAEEGKNGVRANCVGVGVIEGSPRASYVTGQTVNVDGGYSV